MEDVDDLFSEPAAALARPGGRFRPKAKPRPSKVETVAAASTLPNVITEKPVTSSTTVLDAVASVDVGDGKLANPVGSSLATSENLGSIEPSKNNENLCTRVPLSDGNKDTLPCESAAAAALQPEVPASDGNEDCNSSFGKTAKENADIFSGLECLDDYLSQATRGTAESAASKSHDNAKEGSVPHSEMATGSVVNFSAPTHCSAESSAFMVCVLAEAETYSDYCTTQDPVSCKEVSVSNKQGEMQLERKVDGAFSDFEVLDVVTDATISSERPAGKFQPKLKVKKGKENLHIPCSEVESTKLSQAADLVPSETGDMNESSLPTFPPGHVLDHPSPRIGDSSTPNPTSDSQVNTENLAETTHSEDVGVTAGRVGHKSRNGKASTASNLPRKRKSFAASEEAEGGTSSRQLRKRLSHQQVDELVHEANEDILKPSSDSNVNEDKNNDDEYTEQKTSKRKRAPRNSKKPVSEKEKPVRKRKRVNKASDQSTEDHPKKFSHSTRRTKRRVVDKSLLEIPEEEIDTQSLSLKDLIRLAEHREMLAIKEAKKLTTPLPNESATNDSHKEASYNEEETFPSEHDFDENQANYSINASASFLNYQSYMDKAPTARWSKQDTELFYEAIQQCGSDFTMIQELYFPGRTRHQVKLKFKKEERQHPSRISDALLIRSTHSTDHSQFTKYIEKLQQAAQAKKESNADESVGMTGKEEVEVTHDTDEGGTKPESEELRDQEADVEDQEAVAAEVKNDEIDDDDFTWSE